MSYLIAVYATGFVGSMALGFSLAGYNTAGVVLEKKQAWPSWYTTIVNSFAMLGLMLGSLISGQFLVCMGRIKTAYIANVIVIVSFMPQMWLNIGSITLGRFIMGVGAGLSMTSS